jgi:hypothetical protein
MSSTLIGNSRREQDHRTKIHERVDQRRRMLFGKMFSNFQAENQIEAPVQTYWLSQIMCDKSILADLKHVSLDIITVDSDDINYAVLDKDRQPGA